MKKEKFFNKKKIIFLITIITITLFIGTIYFINSTSQLPIKNKYDDKYDWKAYEGKLEKINFNYNDDNWFKCIKSYQKFLLLPTNDKAPEYIKNKERIIINSFKHNFEKIFNSLFNTKLEKLEKISSEWRYEWESLLWVYEKHKKDVLSESIIKKISRGHHA